MAGVRCPNCDTLNRPEAKFCLSCGTRLPAAAPAVYPPPAPPYSPPQPPAGGLPLAQAPFYPPQPEPDYAPQPVAPAPYPAPRKSSWLSTAANLFAWLCVAAFVVLVAVALPVLNASGRLLDAALYKQALLEQDVYNRFPDLFAEQMALSQDELGREAQIDFRGFTAADWKLIAQELTTPQWLQVQVEGLIDQVFAERDPDVPAPALTISLAEVNQRLEGDFGFRIYKAIIQTKRACDMDDLFEIVDWMDDVPSATLPICNIPPMLTEIAAFFMDYDDGDALIRDVIKDLPGAIPDELALTDVLDLPVAQMRSSIALARFVAFACLALAGLALLLVFVSPFGRTLHGWLLLWGTAFSVAGLVGLLEGFLMPGAMTALITGAFGGGVSPGLNAVIQGMAEKVTEVGARTMMVQSGVILLLGLGLSMLAVALIALRRARRR